MRVLLSLYILILFSSNVLSQKQDYLWPTDASTFLSSTFGETRTAHFHAGLDIKTWGKEGFKVFATKDGVLHRIGLSARGYGKVVYLKHDDGTYSLYAHLQSFTPIIQNLADSIRFRDYRFEIDEYVETKGIRFNQGDVIGLSGSSGIGPPHLHFEIRSENEAPFNALSTNLEVKDTRPPILHSILIEPLNAEASINGSNGVKILRPDYKSGYYDFGSIEVSGDIGIALDTYDEADLVYNKYAAYELLMMHGSDTLFQSNLNQYDYEHASDLFIDRAIDPRTGRRRFQRLYNQEALSVNFNNPKYCGCLPNSDETEIILIAKDYYGNESRGRLRIEQTVNQPKQKVSLKTLAVDSYKDNYWSNNWILGPNSYYDLYEGLGIPFSPSLNPHSKSNSFYFSNQHGEWVHQLHFIPDQELTFQSTDQKFSFHFSDSTFFDTTSVLIPSTNNEEFRTEITLYPLDYISKNKFDIEYYVDPDQPNADQLALYKYDRFNDEWDVTPFIRRGNTIHGRNNEFGTYKVFADTLSPEIGKASIFRNESGQWLVRVQVGDMDSGLDYHTSKISVNGIRGIAEYDKEDDFIIYYYPNFKPLKMNLIQVEVEDYVGNKTSKDFNLRF